ncbi:type II secretion system protein N [Oceanicaulis sp. MMSF_3324]|uniref:type II secretion system protein N n=1 Tax=Oceanicaulis sp. MMSF_3324 TaxID=3046702 RepID=UPI00273DE448|nr:type II secretion system protein N [Oceanicaulis sp. MMSF_3324]
MTRTLSSTATAPLMRVNRALALACAVTAVIVLGWVIARAIWFGLFGAAALDVRIDPPRAAASVSSRDASLGAAPPTGLFANRAGQAVQTEEAAPESRLNIALRGVRVGAGAQNGSAIIDAENGRQRIVRVGDEIAPGITVEAIHPDRIEINRRGARESLYLRDRERRQARQVASTAPAPQANTPASPQIDQLIDELDLGPRLRDGALVGFDIGSDADRTWLARFGLEPGDLILALNDTPVSAPDALARALSSSGAYRLSIERDGQRLTLTPSAADAARQE